MIPSSITVSVTLVLMAGPVRIGWMDITVIVHLVSNHKVNLVNRANGKAAPDFAIDLLCVHI